MKQLIIFVTIILVFLALYFFGTSYAILRLQDYFNFKYHLQSIIIPTIIFALILIFQLLQEKISNYLTQGLYNTVYLLFAFSFMLAFVNIIFEIVRFIFKISLNNQTLGYLLILITLTLFLISFANALTYKEKIINVTNNKITKDTKIVQISDLHLFGVNSKHRFKTIFKKVLKINPDYVVITGDLFDVPGKIPENALEITTKYKIPIIFVFGNHDLMYGKNETLDVLKNTNIIILDTNNIFFTSNNINFIGIDFSKDNNNLKDNLNKIKISNKNYNVLLYHEPKEIKIAQEKGINLMLSGHTHGGQVFPITLMVKSMYTYYKGKYTYKDMNIYVNQGTGFWGPKVRLGTRNEITIINLKKI